MQVKNLSILNKCSRGAAGRHPIAPERLFPAQERLFPAQGLEWGRRGNAAAGTLPAQCGEGGSGAAAWGDNAGEGVRRGGYYWASALLPLADGAGSSALRFSSARWACICS